MPEPASRPVQLPYDQQKLANDARTKLRAHLAEHQTATRVSFTFNVTDDGADEPLTLPREAVELLATALDHLAAGRGVALVASAAELTTQQAADLLNVSRPFLIGLLEAGEIAHRTVGTHRRITTSSLLDYQRKDDHRRQQMADELTQLGQEMGAVGPGRGRALPRH
ncbi:helix-turn-helix domain-containing protein [Streptomyces sp. HSW2009]|uniref:helix-turn-helix domain-containing protein n=1 Tax=Streptomyces sp. HSW2009 TaxID=3142890 RepID=UPI0032EE69F2